MVRMAYELFRSDLVKNLNAYWYKTKQNKQIHKWIIWMNNEQE